MKQFNIYDITEQFDDNKIKGKFTNLTDLYVRICRRISDIEFAIAANDDIERNMDVLRDELSECERVLDLTRALL